MVGLILIVFITFLLIIVTGIFILFLDNKMSQELIEKKEEL